MKKASKGAQNRLANRQQIAARHLTIDRMVTEILDRTEPGWYAALLKDFRKEWKPVGCEVQIVELMADLSCRLRGCWYLETEILKRGMAACATSEGAPGDALARAFMHDCEGPRLLNKLSRYESRLSIEFERCARLIDRYRTARKRAEASAVAALMKRKPCTSVVQ